MPWKDTPTGDRTTSTNATSGSTPGASASGSSNSSKTVDFWDTLLKLDQMSNSNKKGKSVARSHSSVGSLKDAATGVSSEAGTNMEDDQGQISFENTPFGQLLGKAFLLYDTVFKTPK